MFRWLNVLILLTGMMLGSQTFAQCKPLWSRLKVDEAPASSAATKSYIVDLELLYIQTPGCSPLGDSINYEVYNSCGKSWQPWAQRNTVKPVDTLTELCIPSRLLSPGILVSHHFTDTFYLDSGNTCAGLLVYFESDPISYQNIDSTGGMPGVSWVFLNTFIKNKPVELNPELRPLEACNGEKRYYQPVSGDADGDSLHIEEGKAVSFDNLGGSFPLRLEQNFKFPFNDSLPIPSFDLGVSDGNFSFTPFDTGFFALPISVEEWKSSNSPFIGKVLASTSYSQLPLFISDSCFRDLYFFGVFDEDTVKRSCGQLRLKVPLSTKVLASSISADGTDFKFANDQGYPAIVKEIFIPQDSLYVDHLEMDVQFFFDGLYSLAIVSGSDQNTVFHECGYELQESDFFFMSLDNCPNAVNIGLQEFSKEIELYPNPFESSIFLNLDPLEMESVEIYNDKGARVPVEVIERESGLELRPKGPPGLYILRLSRTDHSLSSIRLVKI